VTVLNWAEKIDVGRKPEGALEGVEGGKHFRFGLPALKGGKIQGSFAVESIEGVLNPVQYRRQVVRRKIFSQDEIGGDLDVGIPSIHVEHAQERLPDPGGGHGFFQVREGVCIHGFEAEIDERAVRKPVEHFKQGFLGAEHGIDAAEKKQIRILHVGSLQLEDFIGFFGGEGQKVFSGQKGVVLSEKNGVVIGKVLPQKGFHLCHLFQNGVPVQRPKGMPGFEAAEPAMVQAPPGNDRRNDRIIHVAGVRGKNGDLFPENPVKLPGPVLPF